MKSIKIGRSSSNDYTLTSPAVSQQHAILTIYDDGRASIKDLNSTNGTFVNGKKIVVETFIRQGDSIMLGNVPFDWTKAAASAGNVGGRTRVSVGGGLGGMTVGRATDNSNVMSYPDVSSHHARLSVGPDGNVVISDLNSTNGTFVNGARITGSAVLKRGDRVMLANKYPLQWEHLIPGGGGGGIVPPKKKQNNTVLIASLSGVAVVVLAVVAYFLLPYILGPKTWTPEEIYSHYKKSEALIYVESAYVATMDGKPLGEVFENTTYWNIDENGEAKISGPMASTGTGFFISEDGKLMTNRHVVTDPNVEANCEKIKKAIQNALYSMFGVSAQVMSFVDKINVEYKVGYIGIAINDTHLSTREDLSPCSIIKVSKDAELDLAIIQLNSKKTPSEVVNLIDLNTAATAEEMKLGSELYTIGFPQGLTFGSTSIGLEANNQDGKITQECGEYLYGMNISVHHGASGSPVFNKYGKFAGVVVSGYADVTQGYNFAISPIKAAEFGK